jgi:hypothetical protein
MLVTNSKISSLSKENMKQNVTLFDWYIPYVFKFTAEAKDEGVPVALEGSNTAQIQINVNRNLIALLILVELLTLTV